VSHAAALPTVDLIRPPRLEVLTALRADTKVLPPDIAFEHLCRGGFHLYLLEGRFPWQPCWQLATERAFSVLTGLVTVLLVTADLL
jgi:hypothetical protein